LDESRIKDERDTALAQYKKFRHRMLTRGDGGVVVSAGDQTHASFEHVDLSQTVLGETDLSAIRLVDAVLIEIEALRKMAASFEQNQAILLAMDLMQRAAQMTNSFSRGSVT
jgi:hypothetical protein